MATKRFPGRSRISRRAGRGPNSGGSGNGGLWLRIDALARNLWWTWNPQARLFLQSIDTSLWESTNHNPIAVMSGLDPVRREALEHDEAFLFELEKAEQGLRRYLAARSWFARENPRSKMRVAYFCMEYGLHESLPLYAGGLGILAGDHVKSASDLGVPMTCVGILWRKGYYRQELDRDGRPRVLYPLSDFLKLPVTDTGRSISMAIGRMKVRARIWSLLVGRIQILLLDTDVPDNSDEARGLTYHLYKGGDPEHRVQQEMLLGIGGLMALDAMKNRPTVFHLNEGHAAFCPLERVRRLVSKGRSIEQAAHEVRRSSVFTTHTPVPEGNDRFDHKLLMTYFRKWPAQLGLNVRDFLALGREDPADESEPFCMTVLALKLGERCNGVAALHGETSRKMWMKTYGVLRPSEVPIGHVTNGVHPETWIPDEARPFYDRHLKPRWIGAGPEDDWWKAIGRVPAGEFWALRQMLRRRMISELRERLRRQIIGGHEAGGGLDHLVELYETLDENALTIGFARRFALYKRAPLIFRDPRRLARIMGNADRPVQIIFAGKAHPMDAAGHGFVHEVYRQSRQKPFRGRILLLQNYDTSIGRLLTSGCDVWLNNPVRPMEASGTSGMKPPLSGGINFSVLDGWWPEAYNRKNGWQIGNGREFENRAAQDAHDARSIYDTLEREIVPLFYSRDRRGVPQRWVRMMAESMSTVCRRFSSHRMVAEYVNDYYLTSAR